MDYAVFGLTQAWALLRDRFSAQLLNGSFKNIDIATSGLGGWPATMPPTYSAMQSHFDVTKDFSQPVLGAPDQEVSAYVGGPSDIWVDKGIWTFDASTGKISTVDGYPIPNGDRFVNRNRTVRNAPANSFDGPSQIPPGEPALHACGASNPGQGVPGATFYGSVNPPNSDGSCKSPITSFSGFSGNGHYAPCKNTGGSTWTCNFLPGSALAFRFRTPCPIEYPSRSYWHFSLMGYMIDVGIPGLQAAYDYTTKHNYSGGGNIRSIIQH